jgi:hypothetical protein
MAVGGESYEVKTIGAFGNASARIIVAVALCFPLQPVILEFLDRFGDVRVVQNMRRSDLQRRGVLLGERLRLAREPQRLGNIRPRRAPPSPVRRTSSRTDPGAKQTRYSCIFSSLGTPISMLPPQLPARCALLDGASQSLSLRATLVSSCVYFQNHGSDGICSRWMRPQGPISARSVCADDGFRRRISSQLKRRDGLRHQSPIGTVRLTNLEGKAG